jgi:DNA-binding transcriptional regulator YhcF (GntR family)
MMPGVRLEIDPASPVPVSAQLVARLRAGIERGRPGPGERLPPVRTLADELDLAPNTVAKAYRALEEAGYLVGRARAGTFVTDTLPARPDAVEAALRAAAHGFARRTRQLGASEEDALEVVRRALCDPDR